MAGRRAIRRACEARSAGRGGPIARRVTCTSPGRDVADGRGGRNKKDILGVGGGLGARKASPKRDGFKRTMPRCLQRSVRRVNRTKLDFL